MAKKNKRLNILNTQKVFNLTIEDYTPQVLIEGEVKEYLKNEIQEKETEKYLLEKIEGKYLYKLGATNEDYDFVKKLSAYLEDLTIEITTPLPIPLLDYLVRFPRNVVIMLPLVRDEDLSEEFIENIQYISAGLKVTIKVDIDSFYNDAYSVLSILGDLPYIVDEVVLYYTDTSVVDIYSFFNEIRDALSGWKMNIILIVNSSDDKEYLMNRKAEDEQEKKSSTVWHKL